MRSGLRKNYSIILSFLTFILLIPFSRLDFDYHHDGYMLAQIIGISNGFEIHKEIFNDLKECVSTMKETNLKLAELPNVYSTGFCTTKNIEFY